MGGFSAEPSNRFSISHLLSVRPPIARLPNTKDAHAHRLSEALIGVADATSTAGLASAGGGCGGCGSACLGSRRRAGPLGRPLASVRTKPLDEVHAAAAVAALRLIILRGSCGLVAAAAARADRATCAARGNSADHNVKGTCQHRDRDMSCSV